MLKKEIKAYFKAIASGDLQTIEQLVGSNKEYIDVCNVAPPKKDDGQSGLQVAFKTGNFNVAGYLIKNGANVNFMEQSEINEWNAPVLHDCIRATIFNSYTLQKNTARFDTAFSLLQLMLQKGAKPNAIDSYGNNCLLRAFLDSRQMIDNPGADFSDEILLKQLRSVFKVLVDAGADVNLANNDRPSLLQFITNYKMQEYKLV